MNKKINWGILVIIGIGLAGLGIRTFIPRENKELAEAPQAKSGNRKRVLNVNAEIVKEAPISDGISISGLLLPDEEVSLSFETSGKITSINFTEGTHVKKRTITCKSKRCTTASPITKIGSTIEISRRPGISPECLVGKRSG